MRCAVERGGPAATARLDGELHPGGTADALAFLSGELAARPQALLVDLSGLELTAGPVALFTDITRQAAAWPGCSVTLYGQRGPLSDALHALPEADRPALCADRADALLRAQRTEPARLRVQGLSPDPQAPAEARDMLADSCVLWDVPAPAHQLLRQICSELVSNAVRHARTEFTFELRGDHRDVHVAVHDHDPRLPPPPQGRSRDSHGLLLVAALASCWGIIAVPGGKVVWATVGRDAS
ncbi:ATP-binding protein [Catellatospora sp. TT07R-123]|nr:ATP-binding protein [Catellatospora sp. TT07R-123]